MIHKPKWYVIELIPDKPMGLSWNNSHRLQIRLWSQGIKIRKTSLVNTHRI
jgi:hypothetical protein